MSHSDLHVGMHVAHFIADCFVGTWKCVFVRWGGNWELCSDWLVIAICWAIHYTVCWAVQYTVCWAIQYTVCWATQYTVCWATQCTVCWATQYTAEPHSALSAEPHSTLSTQPHITLSAEPHCTLSAEPHCILSTKPHLHYLLNHTVLCGRPWAFRSVDVAIFLEVNVWTELELGRR
jgi:hypothetical protein